MGAIGTRQAQKGVRYNTTFRKGIELIFDQFEQTGSGFSLDLRKERLDMFLHHLYRFSHHLDLFLHQLIQSGGFRPPSFVVIVTSSRCEPRQFMKLVKTIVHRSWIGYIR